MGLLWYLLNVIFGYEPSPYSNLNPVTFKPKTPPQESLNHHFASLDPHKSRTCNPPHSGLNPHHIQAPIPYMQVMYAGLL